jgi:putative polyketide hydroxylase
MNSARTIEVPVLIVGAGPTGLAASLLLSRHGVRSLTVERHPGTSIYPRATGINVRTMEIFRSLGLEDSVRGAAFRAKPRLATSRTLLDLDPSAGDDLLSDTSQISPCRWTSCSQYELEPILLRAVTKQPQAQVLFGTELQDIEQTSGSVIARIAERVSGEVSEVRCLYVIAADGAHSPVRQRLGVPMHGPGELAQQVSIHFRSPLRTLIPHEPYFLQFVTGNGEACMFAPTDSVSRWMMSVPLMAPSGESRATLSRQGLTDLVRERAGAPGIHVEILGTTQWTLQADWADRYRVGCVFMAGDAAHRMTPAGGHGLNTGVQDVHNLCWKLAAVLQGWGSPRLLDTYESERMPVATDNAMHSVGLITGNPGERTGLELDLGFSYSSARREPAGHGFVPSASPGARAPHLWLTPHTSTLDLFGAGFTLMAGSGGGTWCNAAMTLARQRALPLETRKMPDREWDNLYGVEKTGAVLVRPDGHVSWRRAAAGNDAIGELARALTAALGDTCNRSTCL